MEDAVIRQLHSDSSAGGGHAESGTEVLTAATSERLLPHLARVWLRLAANGVSSKWTLLETSERRRSVDTLAEDALGCVCSTESIKYMHTCIGLSKGRAHGERFNVLFWPPLPLSHFSAAQSPLHFFFSLLL